MKSPKIRFKEFQNDWNSRILGEVCNKFDNLRIPVAAKPTRFLFNFIHTSIFVTILCSLLQIYYRPIIAKHSKVVKFWDYFYKKKID